jgi:hypothetical protein
MLTKSWKSILRISVCLRLQLIHPEAQERTLAKLPLLNLFLTFTFLMKCSYAQLSKMFLLVTRCERGCCNPRKIKKGWEEADEFGRHWGIPSDFVKLPSNHMAMEGCQRFITRHRRREKSHSQHCRPASTVTVARVI